MTYSCKHCGLEFTVKQKLGGHSRTCKLNPRYEENMQVLVKARECIDFKNKEIIKCEFCDKSYISSAMNLHVWQYHGEGVYKHDPSIGYKNGTRHGWNKGLTKETDDRIKKIGNSISNSTRGEPRPHRRKNLDLQKLNDYRQACNFNFNLADFPNEFNFSLIEEHGWYSAKNRGNNLNGVSRDHIVSVKFGYENGIDPKVLSHPANCQLLLHGSNVSKGKKCDITYEQLLQKIVERNKKYNTKN